MSGSVGKRVRVDGRVCQYVASIVDLFTRWSAIARGTQCSTIPVTHVRAREETLGDTTHAPFAAGS